MRLDCGKAILRDWQQGDKNSLLHYANNRNIYRIFRTSLSILTRRPTPKVSARTSCLPIAYGLHEVGTKAEVIVYYGQA